MAISTPIYSAPNRITAVPGYATNSTCKVMVVTLFDPTTNHVTLTVNGHAYISGTDFTLTAQGSPVVCYTGVCTVTGLSAFTRYPWTLGQTSYSDSGSLMTAPANTTDSFTVFTAGCDCVVMNANNSTPWVVPGYWQYMKSYAQTAGNLPVMGVWFVDDLGYVDSCAVADNNSVYFQSGQTGYTMSFSAPGASPTYNNYMIGWCALLGMLGPDTTVYPDDSTGLRNSYLQHVLWPREENRSWCRKNLNVWPQWGDHEFADDMGWDKQPTGDNWTYGKQAWEATYGLITPPLGGKTSNGTTITASLNSSAGPRDTSAKHWAFTIGPLTLFSMDGITNAARSSWAGNAVPQAGGTATSAEITQFTSIFGNNQIADVLECVDTFASPYTILYWGHSTRYLVSRTDVSAPYVTWTTPVAEHNYGAQHPIFDHCLSEYKSLITKTGTTPKSLMDNPKTNGSQGNFFMINGDYHHAQVIAQQHPAYTGNAAENFWGITQATTSASSYFAGSPEAIADTMVANCLTEYNHENAPDFHGVRLDITDAGMWLRARLADKNDAALWEKKFMSRAANFAFPSAWVQPKVALRSRK